jgi:hypothetical protein
MSVRAGFASKISPPSLMRMPSKAAVREAPEPLLAPAARLLGLLALGDVPSAPRASTAALPLAPDQRRLVPQPHQAAVPGELAELCGEGVATVVGAPVFCEHPLPVVGVHDLDPVVGVGDALLRGVA